MCGDVSIIELDVLASEITAPMSVLELKSEIAIPFRSLATRLPNNQGDIIEAPPIVARKNTTASKNASAPNSKSLHAEYKQNSIYSLHTLQKIVAQWKMFVQIRCVLLELDD